jgi:uncharacterized membrane protein
MEKVQKLGRWGYNTAIFLTIIGIYASLSPYLLPQDLHHKISLFFYDEAYTTKALPALASFTWTELVHRLFGALFLIIGLFQFNRNFRKNNMAIHRKIGKIYFLFCLTAAISGFIFAFFVPFAGILETFIIAFVSLLMLYYTYKAWNAIQQRNILEHEKFSRYTYAVGLGVVTIRLVAFVLLKGTDIPDPTVLNISFIVGWGLTLAAVYYYHTQLQAAQQTTTS